MKYMLDTSTVVDIFRGNKEALFKFDLALDQDVSASSLVFSEIAAGMQISPKQTPSYLLAKNFLDLVRAEHFDKAAALEAGYLFEHLAKLGRSIGVMDTLIAAHAKSVGATLVTANTKHFARIPGLEIVNWSKPN
ncbi:MAG: type II toxin-antitoxin system VapC family toxin [Actinobacteria bacterium]|nr:type II toxin-antitoxin system VapC family toxin [Actinomycetota bacterium]NDE89488.1 type II toxin-antitoxin system VapC family toxin [Micrococcales bacterium]